MRKPHHSKIRKFFVSTYKMRNRMKQFPPFGKGQEIGIDELKEIVEFGAPCQWQHEIYKQGFDVSDRSIKDSLASFLRGLKRLSKSLCQ